MKIKNLAKVAFASLVMIGSATGTSAYVRVVKASPEVLSRSRVVFRHDSTPEYFTQYRIPALASVQAGPNKGRLVAINDYRPCRGDIGAGKIDLHISISDDMGKTWTPADQLRDKEGRSVAEGTGAEGNTIENLDCGYGDAALVADRTSPEVLLVACCGRMNIARSSRENPQPSARWWSQDGGKTWTHPDYTQWQQVYGLFDNERPIDGQFFASGRIMQSKKIKVGKYYRIYAVSMVQYGHFKQTSNFVLYSDDFGRNWKVLGGVKQAPIPFKGDEAKVEELPNGNVVLSSRGYSGNRTFNIFTYDNQKEATGKWAEPIVSQLGFRNVIPACNGELLILPAVRAKDGKKTYLAMQSIPFGPQRRNVGIVWKELASPADYDTPEHFTSGWNNRYQISNIGSAYSTMVEQTDGRIGFFYEEETLGRDYCEVYLPISISEITKGQYRAVK